MPPPVPEPSLLAADDDNNYNWQDEAVVTFINDLSVGSLFTKVLILVIVVFLVYWLCNSIYRRCRGHDSHQQRSNHGGDVPNSTPNNSNLVDDHHYGDEENLVQNNAHIEAAINSCPCFMYGDKKDDDHQNNTTCPICMCEYLESEMMRTMPQCGHYFHLKCIDEWLRINWSCPVCRVPPLMPRTTPSS